MKKNNKKSSAKKNSASKVNNSGNKTLDVFIKAIGIKYEKDLKLNKKWLSSQIPKEIIADFLLLKISTPELSFQSISDLYNEKYKTNIFTKWNLQNLFNGYMPIIMMDNNAKSLISNSNLMHKKIIDYKNEFEKGPFNEELNALVKHTKLHVKNNGLNKQNKAILNGVLSQEQLLEAIKESNLKILNNVKKIKTQTVKKDKNKRGTIVELLLSDLHYGKKVNLERNLVNAKVLESRSEKLTEVVVSDIKRTELNYNIDKIVIALIGDIIESAHFHGEESLKSSEFGTAQQIQEAIRVIFTKIIVPIASLGFPVEIPCVTGNHDRLGKDKTYKTPGVDNLTYIIYKQLEMLCTTVGLNNVKFFIAENLFISHNIYNNNVLYEHGDELKNTNKDTMVNLMNKRQNQLHKKIDYFRVGHWHEYMMYGRGSIIVNGSLPGQDEYAENKGFLSESIQVLNYYVKTENRRGSFYRSFPICLGEEKN